MSLNKAAELLAQYNKPERKLVNSEADQVQLATWSYANPYDALYERFKENKNFNTDMWHQSIKMGEQDNYIALLEQNKKTDFTPQFYDPSYYNYEAMMLEMYQPFADNDTREERFQEVWDHQTQQIVEESLGEMTEREYLKYQIGKTHELRTEEITRELEQQRKDQMSWVALTGNTVVATLAEFGEGITTGVAGLIDFFVAPLYATGASIDGVNWLDAYIDYYGDKGLLAFEKDTLRQALDDWERQSTYIKNVDGSMTGVGKYLAGISNSIGMMIPAIIAGSLSGGMAWIGMGTFYTSLYGQNLYENANNPAIIDSPSWMKWGNAAVKSGAEALVEWGLNKVLGGTIQNQLLGMSGKTLGKEVSKAAAYRYVLKSAAQEGLEEFLQDFSTDLIDQFTGMIYEGYQHTGVNFQTLMDSFFIGALSSIFMSGGQVAINAGKNRLTRTGPEMKIDGETRKTSKYDILIEGKDGVESVGGFQRLYLLSIFNDFKEALNTLQEQKMSIDKNIELGKEVLSGLTVMTQLYSSFSTERIVNAERLLQRVMAYEQKNLSQADVESIQRADLKDYANILYKEFSTMVGDVDIRESERVKKSLAEVGKKLQENGVTEIKTATKKQTRHKKNPLVVAIENKIKGKVDELSKDYDWVFTTDGHTAVEVDGMLYVSESWLENYENSDVYQFLAQEQLLDNILDDPALAPMVKEMVKHQKEFTGQETYTSRLSKGGTFLEIKGDINEAKIAIDGHFCNARDGGPWPDTHFMISYKGQTIDVTEYAYDDTNKNRGAEDLISRLPKANTAEQALMNFLFHPQVYQHFLLSNRGQNLHKFKDFIFRLQEFIKKDGLTAKRKAFLNKIYEQIKQNFREPTLKAVLNWNMDPQLVGADTILSKADLEFVRGQKAKRKMGVDAVQGKISASHKRRAEVLLENGQFTQAEKDIIERGLGKNLVPTERDRLVSHALLSEADYRYTVYDFDVGGMMHNSHTALRILSELNKISDDASPSKVKSLVDSLSYAEDVLHDKPDSLAQINELYELADSSVPELLAKVKEVYATLRNAIVEAAREYSYGTKSPGIFAIPPQAFLQGENLAAYVQRKADVLIEFAKIYGIPANILITGDFSGMTQQQIDRMHQEMEVFGVDNSVDFVIRKIEALLNNEFVVTPVYKVTKSDRSEYDSVEALVTDFEIIDKIPAEQLLKDGLTTNEDFLYSFEKEGNIAGRERYAERELTAFLKTDAIKGLHDWTVKLVDFPKENWSGEVDYIDRQIRINISVAHDFVSTLVHEINHAIQYEYKITRGFNQKTVAKMPDFIDYIIDNYTEVVSYVSRRRGYNYTVEDIKQVMKDSPEIKKVAAYVAYRLVQGELWAEYHMHNGKLVKGFTQEYAPSGTSYIVSPDGKRKFEIPYEDVESKKLVPKASDTDITTDPIYTKNAMERTYNEIFGIRSLGDTDKSRIRDTYHTSFTKNSSQFVQRIVNKNLPLSTQLRVTINDIILNPQQYLSQELLDVVNARGSTGEGSVYHALKEWFEDNTDGVSIDRDGTTHEYIFVDDNAFDDTLTSELFQKRNDDKGNDLVTKYSSEDGITLNRFYSVLKLMGIPSGIKVIANENVVTETIFDRSHPNGLITIQTYDGMTNAEFINALNHEFRHIMQHYNNFEQGFTTEFEVTHDMLKDMKKHVPEIFKDERMRKLVKKGDPDIAIARAFVYYMIGAEQNAYGFKSKYLNNKPAYVTTEAGNPTIFMPWYDAKTGDGRYRTKFLAARKSDDGKKSTTKKVTSIPRVEKPKKGTKVDGKWKYTNNRHFTLEEAKGTNLEYFYKKNKQNQMDPDLQNFIKATTGHNDEIRKSAPALIYAIEKGKLTKDAFYTWFREVKPETVSDFVFNLVNKHMFKNTVFKSMTELAQYVDMDVSYVWAAINLLRQEGIDLDVLAKQNDFTKLKEVIDNMENSAWDVKIKELQKKFFTFKTKRDGEFVEVSVEQYMTDWMRVLAMQYFNGSLSGAYYTSIALRKLIRDNYAERNKKKDLRLEGETSAEDGTLADVISTDYRFVSNDVANADNSILALYDIDMFGVDPDNMKIELGIAARDAMKRKAERLGYNPAEYERKAMPAFVKKLDNMDLDDLAYEYSKLKEKQMTGQKADNILTPEKPPRVNLVRNIQDAARGLVKYVEQGRAVWQELPQEVRDLFTIEKVKIGKNTLTRPLLKPEVYSVGRGRKKGTKVNLAVDVDYTKDVTRLIEVRDLLREARADASKFVYATRETSKKVEKLERENQVKDRKLRELRQENVKLRKAGQKLAKTEFITRTKNKTSDQPNNFTIVSGVEMPTIVRTIYDTSFEKMAPHEVQFVSTGDTKHEVKTWDVFYEANRETLLNLTRTDVLDIVEFIQRGATIFEGPSGKLKAFEIFSLGYIVSGARENVNNWNFSKQEIEIIEKLYEQKAHEAGSALNAVGQMIKVIDPLKKIRQRMLDRFNISDGEVQPLFEAIDDLQNTRGFAERKKKAITVMERLKELEKLMHEREIDMKSGEVIKRGFGKRWYQKLKSARYTFMLSSPMTWVRNIVSDVIVSNFNKAADSISQFVFAKKGYRKEQWDLAGTKITDEVRRFIDDNIYTSPLFELLYDNTTKYDDRGKQKKTGEQKELFIKMIVQSLERNYAAGNRFDSDTANWVASFVNKMISDRRFVKVAAGRYLGKILTIEVAKGNVRLDQGLSNEILNFFADAVILANTDYMRKRSFLADMIDGLKNKNPIAYEVLTWWQPFMNSSFNWFTEMLKYSPLGLLNAVNRMRKLESRIDKITEKRDRGELVFSSRATEYLVRRDIGKGIIGLLLTSLGMLLGFTGVLRIDEDDDKYYMTAGKVKVDISNLFGSSSILVGASLGRLIQGEKADTILTEVFNTRMEGFLLKDILDKHRWNQGGYEMMLTETESILRSFVPQMVQLIIRATNNEQIRYTKGFKGMWERWLNSWVPMQPVGDRKINPYTGETITKYAIPFVGEFLKGGILGPRIFWNEVSEIEAFAREYNINKNELTGELNGIENVFDREQLNEYYGKLNKKSLTEIQQGSHYVQMEDGTFRTLTWSRLSDIQKARVINRTMIQNGEIAKIYMWTQMGHKYYASDSLWQTLRQLKITANVYKGDRGFVE